MIDLKSMTQEEMRSFFQEMGQPKFRAKQVFQWLHRGASGFQEQHSKDSAAAAGTNLPT